MNEPPLDDEELKILRRIIHAEEGRQWFRQRVKEKLKLWAIWVAVVTTLVGSVRSFVTDYWMGKH